jgi:hypothetical protein
MATNYTNDQIGSITASNTVPPRQSKTGTIETIGINVIGTGTLFTTELQVGDYLSDLAAGEIRRIVKISMEDGDTNAYLDKPFSVNLPAGTALRVTPKSRVRVISLQAQTGGTPITVNGTQYPVGQTLTFGKIDTIEIGARKDYVDPLVVVVPPGTTVIYTLLY